MIIGGNVKTVFHFSKSQIIEVNIFDIASAIGIGFDKKTISNGIGHKNIKTRIDFLNAQLDVDSSSTGTSYTISIDLNKVK